MQDQAALNLDEPNEPTIEDLVKEDTSEAKPPKENTPKENTPQESTPKAKSDNQETAPAPVEQVETPLEPKARTQKRMKELLADRYAESKRADDLQRVNEQLRSQIPAAPESNEPKLEDFDFDQDKFNTATINFQVKKQVNEGIQAFRQETQQATNLVEGQRLADKFNANVAEFSKKAPDYNEVVDRLNTISFPDQTVATITHADDAAKLLYHLGNNLEVADQIAQLPPHMAGLALGKISASFDVAAPNVQPSAAPKPIEPISSGGAVSKEAEDMSVEEICRLE